MKVIDLHCHTIAAKTGDAPTRAVTPVLFAEQLSAAGVEIAAVTNHNLFNIDQYRDLVFASKGIAQVWPGAELDVTRDDEHWHMIVVCDPSKAEVFSTELARLVGSKKPDDVMLDFDSVWEWTGQGFLDRKISFFSQHLALGRTGRYSRSMSASSARCSRARCI